MSERLDDPARPPVWARLAPGLPPLVFLATFGVFFVDKTREAGTVLRSGRGLLTVAAVGVGYAAVSWTVRRAAGQAWVASVVMAGVILGLAAWIVRPYYVDSSADRVLVTGPVEPAPAAAPPGTTAPAPAAAQRVATGRLVGLDHHARGSVSLIRTAEGGLVVRFEDFDIEGVPDPRIHLVEGEDVRRAGGTSLGRLPGNTGQVLDVAVPDGVDAGPGWTVLVWCRAFSVPVANATLAA